MENVQLTPADMQVVRDREWLAAWTAEIPEMFAQGVVGYADDRLADGQGWASFDVTDIRCPVVILHGEADLGVPVAHAVLSGLVVDLEGALASDGGSVQLDVRVTKTRLHTPFRTLPTAHGDVELPELDVFRVRTSVHVPLAATALAGAHHDGERSTLLLVTPQVR